MPKGVRMFNYKKILGFNCAGGVAERLPALTEVKMKDNDRSG
jgi:hypothetical protein